MDSFEQASGPQAYTLSQFSRFVASAMSREPVLMGAWVTAEISDLSSSGGHCYMTLLEKDAKGITIARMRATIWANRFLYIRNKFLRETGKELANGMKVMFYGAANYHNSYGLSFNIGEINSAYTMGDLERLRREILTSLQREGILECNKALRITEPPLKIAVISSENAAGYGDFINQIKSNPIGVEFHTFLFPAVLQGEKTAQSVIAALDLVEQTHSIIGWDCVVIIRGGGATTDMNGFDDLQLARRVATFPIPVVVGIGHERDRCVLDEIACIRCKTPTAVAAWLADTVGMAWQKANELASRITTCASEKLKGEHIRLQGIETMVPALVDAQLNNAKLKLHSISTLIPSAAREATSKARIRIEGITTTLRIASHNRIQLEYPALEGLSSKLTTAATTLLEREKTRLDSLDRLTEVLNPASTLKRGYSITKIDGRAVTSAEKVKAGDRLETFTANGSFKSIVEK